MKTIFKGKDGLPVYVLGLQTHNSSNGCWEMIEKSICAVKLYHGNTLEVPVYWSQIEPVEGQFDFSMVEELLLRIRKSGLHLILLWFGFSKNADCTYLPDWAKQDPKRFRLAVGPDGAVVPMMSPHCLETIGADKKAFVELMKFLREADGKTRTVLAVQVENEIGLYPIDRCYSKKAQEDFDKGVPAALEGVTLEDSGADGKGNTWINRFGRYANEAFSAWYFGIAVERVASAGKAVYPDLPLYMNTMIGEIRQEIAGQSYSSGSPAGRVLDIWKKAAPSISLYAPDIYQPSLSGYLRPCAAHSREDNPLFIPETGTGGDGFAINIIHAAADYGAIGICGFGAEHTLDADNQLTEDSEKVAVSMQILSSMAPMLLRYGGTDSIFCVTQEEFQSLAYVKREKYHITVHFTNRTQKGGLLGRNLRVGEKLAGQPDTHSQRGRVLVYEASPWEYYLAGAGATVRFLRRTEPNDPCPYKTYLSRAATELAALTIEEGHFDNTGKWVCEFVRRGDEIDCGAFVYPGIVLRVKMNPDVLQAVDW